MYGYVYTYSEKLYRIFPEILKPDSDWEYRYGYVYSTLQNCIGSAEKRNTLCRVEKNGVFRTEIQVWICI